MQFTSLPKPPASELVKVLFPLPPPGEGFPPYTAETLWTRSCGEVYEIQSIPFFVPEVHHRDLVAAAETDDGTLEFLTVLEASGHETVIATPLAPAADDLVRGAAEALGCRLETAAEEGLFAIDVPPDADGERLLSWLDRADAEGLLAWWVNTAEETPYGALQNGSIPHDGVLTCACCGVPLFEEADPTEDMVLLEVRREPTPFWRICFDEEPGAQGRQCSSCQVAPGAPHRRDCSLEQCPNCPARLAACPCRILAWGRSFEEEE
jgi:hypothetical protein